MRNLEFFVLASVTLDNKTDKFNLLPAMQRRRMSKLSKLAVQTALLLMQQEKIDYLIFASRHGEIARTTKIISDIVQDEDISPMAFAQSVHNTAVGLTTIIAKKAIAATSIAAGGQTVYAALIEAYTYLQVNNQDKVLVVVFDEQIPDIYAKEQDISMPMAHGVVLSKGDAYQFIEDKEVDLATWSRSMQKYAMATKD